MIKFLIIGLLISAIISLITSFKLTFDDDKYKENSCINNINNIYMQYVVEFILFNVNFLIIFWKSINSQNKKFYMRSFFFSSSSNIIFKKLINFLFYKIII